MARLYSNENFPLSAVETLRRFGHDVLTTADSGRAGQAIPDAEVLAFAIAELRSVVTLNRRHFIQLHHTTPEHAGIVVCTFDPDFVPLALRIHTALEARPQMAGQLVRIHRSGSNASTVCSSQIAGLDGNSAALHCRRYALSLGVA
jgi:Domain of unknown function (DUF5615)